MIRGGDFYAIWDEENSLWSTSELDVIRIIDNELDTYAKEHCKQFEDHLNVLHMWDAESGIIDQWHKYCQKQLRDNYHLLDEKLVFSNDDIEKEDYCSKTLSYPISEGDMPAYNELMSILYSDTERLKLEWAIGAIITGDSKKIQKFLVLYGAPGTGKSTFLNIVSQLFDGYCNIFDADSLGSSSATFALEQLKSNPLVAICHDADLSRIDKNNTINSLVSHERMTVNEKHKSLYTMKFNSFLLIGTNKPVKITDAKSGIIRRLIDVYPTGNKLALVKYNALLRKIPFELGAIAHHCRDVYNDNKDIFDDYKPMLMMDESNDFYNFVLDSYTVFNKENGTSLRTAWEMYKNYCEDAKVPYQLSMRLFKSELKNYFTNYEERIRVNEEWIRSYYSGFKTDLFDVQEVGHGKVYDNNLPTIIFKEQPSILDTVCADCPAQYSTEAGTPLQKWSKVNTKLKDIDTSKVHYLKVPDNLVVIDFDIKDENGNKSFDLNLKAASEWPKTYAELSKSGGGIHLHYFYDGDISQLSRIYANDIEIKVFSGNSSLRRKLTKCNNEKIATINSGLPLKGGKKVINFESVTNEKALRTIIKKNLNKEYHAGTKPSMDFIYKVIEDAYNSGMKYDISDLHGAIYAFAANSTHQSDYCVRLIPKMHFKSDDASDFINNEDKPIVFFDVEVFPNLFLVNWKVQGEGKAVQRMINPMPKEIESLLKYRLVGFNNRKYDNHMLYGRLIGYSCEQLYNLSQRIIAKQDKNAFFGEAYNISYTDIYDYCSNDNKMSLKKWEIKLKIHHKELGLPWDQPVPEEKWIQVAEYCDNDVIATEAVWNATQEDFMAREILADITDSSVNETTNALTTKFIFQGDKNPELNYVDLSEEFPGYEFVKETVKTDRGTEKFVKKNMYRGDDLGFGGYVSAVPGMYGNVALLDVASMHPHSVIAMNALGKYTKRFEELVKIRVLIKHKKFDEAKLLLDGKLNKYLDDLSKAEKLAKALKTAINSVYGLTSAKFINPFHDPRNENNIVALRGALFMRTLQDEVIKRGFIVAHIKTDSIKIPDATPEIIKFCLDFAKKYGYEFEHEATYERMCIVNNAVYIAKFANAEQCMALYGYIPSDNEKVIKKGETLWTATGAQFKVPYVFKKCFSHEQIEFDDLCETKEVKTSIYLDMNEELPEGEHDYRFIGRVGLFCPIIPGAGGGQLLAERNKSGEITYDSVTGAKDFRWLEAEDVVKYGYQDKIDMTYYDGLVHDAIYGIHEKNKDVKGIADFGDYEWFVSDDPYEGQDMIDGHPDYNSLQPQINNPFI